MEKYEYPKINTLFKRDEKTHHIIESEITSPEFLAIKKWYVTEKVDGMNIRVFWNPKDKSVTYKGHHENSQIPKALIEYLDSVFTTDKMEKQFGDSIACQFGEGHGDKIQKGGNYRPDNSFILFDAIIGDIWLQPESVKNLAVDLGIDYVPFLGEMTIEEIQAFVKSKPKSKIAQNKEFVMEGVVCRSIPLMLFRKNKTPIMFKLKDRDYEEIKDPQKKKEKYEPAKIVFNCGLGNPSTVKDVVG
jgi:hypothetical protein